MLALLLSSNLLVTVLVLTYCIIQNIKVPLMVSARLVSLLTAD